MYVLFSDTSNSYERSDETSGLHGYEIIIQFFWDVILKL